MALITTALTIEGSNLGLFLKPILEYPLVKSFGFTTVFGQRDGYAYFMTPKDKITKKTTDCGYPTPTAGTPVTRKLLSPVFLDAYDTQCARDFDNTIFAEMRRAGMNTNDLTGTAIEALLLDIYRPIVARDMTRIAMLGDTASGSADYSQLDGWYKLLKAQVPAAQSYGTVSDASLAVGAIKATFKAIWDKQTLRLRQTPNNEKAWYVTRPVFDAWQEYLMGLTGIQSSKDEIVNGTAPTTYRGIELIVMDIVDQYLVDVDSTSGVVNTPNRIIYAKKDQTFLMLDSPLAGEEYKSWYDINSDLNKFDSRYRMALQIGFTDYFVIAGF